MQLVRRTLTKSATMGARSETVIVAVASTPARMTAAGWPRRALTSPMAALRVAEMLATMGVSTSTVASALAIRSAGRVRRIQAGDMRARTEVSDGGAERGGRGRDDGGDADLSGGTDVDLAGSEGRLGDGGRVGGERAEGDGGSGGEGLEGEHFRGNECGGMGALERGRGRALERR